MRKQAKWALPLREDPFFRALSEPLVARMEGLVYHREYEPRQIVFFPDDPCDYVYWVRDGAVRITRRIKGSNVSGAPRELTFRHLFAGDLFGEECLVERARREAYAEALTKTVLCLMRAGDFRRTVREEGELSLMVARRLCARAVEAEEVLAEMAFRTVRSRVASGLMRLHHRAPQAEPGALRVTHQELASLVGSTRETTTAVLHGLREDGILDIANRCVIVRDAAGLEHVARNG